MSIRLKLFEEPAIAAIITDRLLNPSTKLLLKGGSYHSRLLVIIHRSSLSEWLADKWLIFLSIFREEGQLS